jgi:hypothetical protein
MPYHTLSNKIAIPVLFFLLLPVFINAQGKDETLAEKIKLEQKITESKTIAEKIQKTNSLALFHFAHNNNKAGDSLIDIIAILWKERRCLCLLPVEWKCLLIFQFTC